ncbi:hypothetical protein AMTR_s00005p00147860 [Amborella trichopoda]|uniref:Uncharacterized protein n=1 Tax=Amborella trichopoda TaxID=13333 RepID=W1PA58_AMBTC|nr:hypothetical protein AMTR_s00005p00147860 [Amborella trichopoda]
MSQENYLSIWNYLPHQYLFSINIAPTKSSLLKWDQGCQEAEEGEADPERLDYKAFKRKGSDVISTGIKDISKLQQQGTESTQVTT